MKHLGAIGWLALLACGGKAQPAPDLEVITLPATVTLAVGEDRHVHGVTVRFGAVKNDSRCPSDVQCVWAGDAEVDLVLTPDGGGTAERLALHTTQEPRAGTARGLTISLLSLAPVPVSTDTRREYRAELRIVAAP